MWNVSDRSTPSGLEKCLRALGFELAPRDPETRGMVMTTPPPLGPPEVNARPVRSADEFAAARLLLYDAFEIPAERRLDAASLHDEFEQVEESGTGTTYGAWIGERLAGAARSFFAPQGALLAVAGTASWARGRGAYRALVRARWDDLVRRGGGSLVVIAGAMSAPILDRLGFETVVHFRRLRDVLSSQ